MARALASRGSSRKRPRARGKMCPKMSLLLTGRQQKQSPMQSQLWKLLTTQPRRLPHHARANEHHRYLPTQLNSNRCDFSLFGRKDPPQNVHGHCQERPITCMTTLKSGGVEGSSQIPIQYNLPSNHVIMPSFLPQRSDICYKD